MKGAQITFNKLGANFMKQLKIQTHEKNNNISAAFNSFVYCM